MLLELRCVGTHASLFAVSTKGNRFLTSYLPPLMTRPFSKGSTLKGKKPYMSNDIFLQELTPIEKGGENENGSGFPIKCTHSD